MNTHIIDVPAVHAVLGRPDLEELTAMAIAQSQGIQSIQDEEQCAAARGLMCDINSLVKELEGQRTGAKRPLLDAGKLIDNAVKPMSQPLEKCILHLKLKLADYDMIVERKRQEAEAERLRLEAAAVEEARATGRVPALVTSVELPMAAGVAHSTTTDYTVDMNLLPREFCLPDEKKIKAAIAAGISIPGVTVTKRRTIRAS